MAGDIRYAGVDQRTQSKLRQAAPILTMQSVHLHKTGLKVDEWDGQSCDLLVAQAGDETGRAAIAQAAGKGITVVAIGDAEDVPEAVFNIPPDSSTAALTRTLKRALDTG